MLWRMSVLAVHSLLVPFSFVATDGFGQASAVDSVRALLAEDTDDAALSYAESSVRARPEDASSHCALAVAHRAARDLELAVESGERCVKLDSNVSDYQHILGEALIELAREKGGLGAVGTAKRGKAATEKAIKLDPDNVPARLLLYLYLVSAPGIAGGSKKKAERQADEIGKRDPALGVWAHYRLRFEHAKDDELTQFFDEALPLAGTALDSAGYAMDTATQVMARVKSNALAERLTEKLYQARPNDPRARYYRARLWALQGRNLEQAEEFLVSYVELPERPRRGPSFARAHWRLGLVYEKQGRKEAALEQYRMASEIFPDWEDPKKDIARLEKELALQ